MKVFGYTAYLGLFFMGAWAWAQAETKTEASFTWVMGLPRMPAINLLHQMRVPGGGCPGVVEGLVFSAQNLGRSFAILNRGEKRVTLKRGKRHLFEGKSYRVMAIKRTGVWLKIKKGHKIFCRHQRR
jgi:hypothetical protein